MGFHVSWSLHLLLSGSRRFPRTSTRVHLERHVILQVTVRQGSEKRQYGLLDIHTHAWVSQITSPSHSRLAIGMRQARGNKFGPG